jgi:hypothetical protein
MSQRVIAGSGLALAALMTTALMATSAAQAETRSYVVNWFYDANYYDEKTCPEGLNPASAEFFRHDLARIGVPRAKIEELMKDFPGEGGLPQPWVPYVLTRGNGKDNIYQNPESMPDPQLKSAKGSFAYGFNLDGKVEKDGFKEPLTGEAGVDNQLFRAMGCMRAFRGLPGGGRPNSPEIKWDVLRNQMPAWLLTVTRPDGGADGEATVTIHRATDPVTRDGSGTNVQADMTYRLDSNPRAHSVIKGAVKGGVFTAAADEVNIVMDQYVSPELRFKKAHLRLAVQPDGGLKGMIGGYLPWYPIYFGQGVSGYVAEYASSIHLPGLHYNLKKFADADPDPVTGQNRQISSAFFIEAVPAYVQPAKDKVATTASAN